MQRLVTMLQQAEDYVGTVVDGNLPADPHMGRKVKPVYERASYSLLAAHIPHILSCHVRRQCRKSSIALSIGRNHS